MVRKGLLLLAAFSLVGCLWASEAPPEDLLAAYRYDSAAVRFENASLPPEAGIRVSRLTFTSQVPSDCPANQVVNCRVYWPDAKGRVPAVVVLHEWKVDRAERAMYLCRRLARAGMLAVLVPLPYHLDRTPPGAESGKLMVSANPNRTVNAVVQAVVDVRCVVDWLVSLEEVDGQRIGLAGISLGAMVGLLATQVEPRFRAAVSILGTACPMALFKDSPLVRLLLWRRLRQAGLSEEELREKFRVVDATEFAGDNAGLKLLMINARHDIVVPRSAVMLTWQRLGKPDLLWLNSGHWSAGIYSRRLAEAVVGYLKTAFGLAPGPYKPPPMPSSAVDVGLLVGSRSGLVGAIIFEALSLESSGRASVDIGMTTRGPFLGVSVRPFEYGKIGYGLRPFSNHSHGEVFWMLQVTF